MTHTTDPLGPRIRRLREAAGWSRRELALAASVNEMSVYHWEHGHCRLQYRSRQLVAQAFGMTVQELEGAAVDLEPGWLSRQLAKNADEVDLWPGWMRKEVAARAQRAGRPEPTYRQPPPEERIPQLQAAITALQAQVALVWIDVPTSEGWYWYAIGTSRNWHGPTEVHRINGVLCAMTGDGEGWKPCTHFHRRWAGPLPVPGPPP